MTICNETPHRLGARDCCSWLHLLPQSRLPWLQLGSLHLAIQASLPADQVIALICRHALSSAHIVTCKPLFAPELHLQLQVAIEHLQLS